MPTRPRDLGICSVGLAAALCGLGCETQRPPRIEDDARAMAPVPACITPLAARTHGAGQTMRNLSEDQTWQVVFPAFDAVHHQLPADSLACTGAAVFRDALFAGGTTRGNPIVVQSGDVVYGNGGDRVRIVWLRTHRWSDGTEAGPLALVRAKEDFAEVYAVGSYRRLGGNVTLQAERLGTEVLVSVTDDGCQGQPKTAPCTTTVTLFMPRLGHLDPVATFSTEQRALASGGEPGVMGAVTYELTASPQYSEKGISLFEQVKAMDAQGRVVHKTELERLYLLHEDGSLEESSGSLWSHLYPGVAQKQGGQN